MRLMIQRLQIFENDKYEKWMAEYWLAITSLPDDQAAYLRGGLFAQSMTGKHSCLPLDLWIEITKMKVGWLKIL